MHLRVIPGRASKLTFFIGTYREIWMIICSQGGENEGGLFSRTLPYGEKITAFVKQEWRRNRPLYMKSPGLILCRMFCRSGRWRISSAQVLTCKSIQGSNNYDKCEQWYSSSCNVLNEHDANRRGPLSRRGNFLTLIFHVPMQKGEISTFQRERYKVLSLSRGLPQRMADDMCNIL